MHPTRSIINKIITMNNVWMEATVSFEFEGHFKSHKAHVGYLSSASIVAKKSSCVAYIFHQKDMES